jgi:hypothetical protein
VARMEAGCCGVVFTGGVRCCAWVEEGAGLRFGCVGRGSGGTVGEARAVRWKARTSRSRARGLTLDEQSS